MGVTAAQEPIAKITITLFRTGGVAHNAVFSRPDGMVIGQVQGPICQFGEDPEAAVTRAFIEYDCAVAWAKGMCREYCGRGDVDFIVVEGNPMVEVAGKTTGPLSGRPGPIIRRQ